MFASTVAYQIASYIALDCMDAVHTNQTHSCNLWRRSSCTVCFNGLVIDSVQSKLSSGSRERCISAQYQLTKHCLYFESCIKNTCMVINTFQVGVFTQTLTRRLFA